jgi:hypothetical protein
VEKLRIVTESSPAVNSNGDSKPPPESTKLQQRRIRKGREQYIDPEGRTSPAISQNPQRRIVRHSTTSRFELMADGRWLMPDACARFAA